MGSSFVGTKISDESRCLNMKDQSDSATSLKCTQNVNNFFNVIMQEGADPWVYKHNDGWYYYTQTTGNNIRIWRSHSFTVIEAAENHVVWRPPSTGPACCAIWAPELHFIGSCWYIYFAATPSDGNNENHRMFVLENTNADPFKGSFIMKGQITDSTNKWAIDGTVLKHPSGQLYFIWSGWEGDVNGMQLLYIAQMSNPWTICSKRVEISRPIHSWETNHQPMINEGPEIIIHNDVLSLVYSASGSWTNDYCLGLITTSINSDPLQPSSWQKRPLPIFCSTKDLCAPGHHSFTKSPDDTEDWMVYHTARFSGAGWTRQVRAQPFTWNDDLTPNFGSPVNPNSPIPLPSGDQSRDRYDAKDACLLNGPYPCRSKCASSGYKVGHIDSPDSTVAFTVECSKAGVYIAVIRTCNGSQCKQHASHWLTINDKDKNEVQVVYSGWENWGSSMVRVNLQEGANILTFRKGTNFAEIDTLDICLAE